MFQVFCQPSVCIVVTEINMNLGMLVHGTFLKCNTKHLLVSSPAILPVVNAQNCHHRNDGYTCTNENNPQLPHELNNIFLTISHMKNVLIS